MSIQNTYRTFLAIVALVTAGHTAADEKPLKVYILAGQSNMQGKAQVRTIERLKYAGGNEQMYKDMMGDDDKLDAPKGVHGVYFTDGDMKFGTARPVAEVAGPYQPGFIQDPTPEVTFGPDYTFGIYMQKHLGEPIMIIKTAWGGRNLLQQFRPPSAGAYEEAKDKHGNDTGAYYQLIIKHVNNVLADLGKYHPDYDPKAGYEIAGFVWFQGFNDLIGSYPDGDFSEYSRLLACFIRDVRKDLKVPNMPFVIGVMGIGGPITNEKDNQFKFRMAQAAPASMPEFKGNVVAVKTAECWDMELERINQKLSKTLEEQIKAKDPNINARSLRKAVQSQMKKEAANILTPEELKIREVGKSNEAFHYMGSALTYGAIGKAFADAMHELSSKK